MIFSLGKSEDYRGYTLCTFFSDSAYQFRVLGAEGDRVAELFKGKDIRTDGKKYESAEAALEAGKTFVEKRIEAISKIKQWGITNGLEEWIRRYGDFR
jgi:hypothetical protein